MADPKLYQIAVSKVGETCPRALDGDVEHVHEALKVWAGKPTTTGGGWVCKKGSKMQEACGGHGRIAKFRSPQGPLPCPPLRSPAPSSMLPAPCSLLPAPSSLLP